MTVLSTVIAVTIALGLGFTAGALVVTHIRDSRTSRLHLEISSLKRKLRQERERADRQHRGPFYLSPAPTSTPDTPEGR